MPTHMEWAAEGDCRVYHSVWYDQRGSVTRPLLDSCEYKPPHQVLACRGWHTAIFKESVEAVSTSHLYQSAAQRCAV